jgi:hypothetical protein
MSELFIFINTVGIRDGRREEWVKQFHEFSQWIAEQEPRLLYFQTHVNDEGTEAAIFQIHPDADHMLHHLSIISEHAHEVGELLDFSRMSYQVYGNPSEELLAQILGFVDDVTPLELKTTGSGFHRLPER